MGQIPSGRRRAVNLNIFALGLGAMAGLMMAVQGAMNAMLTKAIGIFETSLIANLMGFLISGAWYSSGWAAAT